MLSKQHQGACARDKKPGMLSVLADQTYRHLFAAQVLSLIGTGLTTVALGLLAYDLAGADAGLVLGGALAIKMVAYVGISPIAAALASRFPRRPFLVSLDLVRAGMVMLLPLVTEVWQIYALVFLFQACSAAFTPTFQATIPDVLADERDYTNALSLSRLAYDLEALLSPLLAGLLLTVTSFHWLFIGNAAGFLASAALVVSVALPTVRGAIGQRPFRERLTRGVRFYLKTPRLKGLLALSLATASAGAMVIVNTVVLVRETLNGDDRDVAILFVAYGIGSMLVALTLPRLLAHVAPRPVMLAGGALVVVALAAVVPIAPGYSAFLALWIVLGAGTSLIQTPAGLLLKRSARTEDRPALFAAHFALSHACWLVTYPAAGWLGARIGLEPAFAVLAGVAALGVAVAALVWPRHDPLALEHEHREMVHTHGSVDDAHHVGAAVEWIDEEGGAHRHHAFRHSHVFTIDDHHPEWPRRGD